MNTLSLGTLFFILGVLLVLSAFFSGSETGMMSVNRYKLKHLSQHGHRGAQRVQALLQQPDRLIGLILIGNNLVNIAASAVATVIGLKLYGDYGILIATVALTLMILVFSEITPKTIAALNPERIAYPSAIVLKYLMYFFNPLVIAVNSITNILVKLFGVDASHLANKDHLSTDELRTIVHDAGSMIPSRYQEMLLSILDLEKVTVDDIMIPRNEINAIDIHADWDLINRQLMSMQNTLTLLYRGEIDDAIGFLHARDILHLMTKYHEDLDKPALVRAVREIYYIPEGTPLSVQLVKFQENRERIGLVVDEYGDIQGLVTLEDILEEIVGDFTTNITGQDDTGLMIHEDSTITVEGTINLRELNKELKLNFPTDGPKTLNGLIIEILDDIPEHPLCLKIQEHQLEIIEVADNAIKSVRIQPRFKKRSKLSFNR